MAGGRMAGGGRCGAFGSFPTKDIYPSDGTSSHGRKWCREERRSSMYVRVYIEGEEGGM